MSILHEQLILEYENGTDEGQTKTIYAAFGLAVYVAQCLEKTFENLLITKGLANSEIKTQEEAKNLINKIDEGKKTLGKLIITIKKEYDISNEDAIELNELLEIRNFLTHRYFKVNAFKFKTDLGKREMLKFFSDFVDRYASIDKRLERYDDQYKIKIGMTRDRITKWMNEMEQEEIERVNQIEGTD